MVRVFVTACRWHAGEDVKLLNLANRRIKFSFILIGLWLLFNLNSCLQGDGIGVNSKGDFDGSDAALCGHPLADSTDPQQLACYCDTTDPAATCFVCDTTNPEHYLNQANSCFCDLTIKTNWCFDSCFVDTCIDTVFCPVDTCKTTIFCNPTLSAAWCYNSCLMDTCLDTDTLCLLDTCAFPAPCDSTNPAGGCFDSCKADTCSGFALCFKDTCTVCDTTDRNDTCYRCLETDKTNPRDTLCFVPTLDYSTQIEPIFDKYLCTVCHVVSGDGCNLTGRDNRCLDLTEGLSYDRLVNQPTYLAPDKQPRWRVLPFEPDSSFLIQKLSSPSPKSGLPMPYDNPSLHESVIDTLRTWILEGARRSL